MTQDLVRHNQPPVYVVRGFITLEVKGIACPDCVSEKFDEAVQGAQLRVSRTLEQGGLSVYNVKSFKYDDLAWDGGSAVVYCHQHAPDKGDDD